MGAPVAGGVHDGSGAEKRRESGMGRRKVWGRDERMRGGG